MNRRQFLSMTGAVAGWAGGLSSAHALPPSSSSIGALVIVDLDGGNDSLNTVIPFDDPRYRALRPTLAVPRDRVVPLDAQTALHPSLLPLMPAWHARDMAIVQGVGYDAPNRSHYRSREIWDTASQADEYRNESWLAPHTHAEVASCDAAAQRIIARGTTDGVDVIRVTLHGFDTHENQAHRHAMLLGRLADGLASLRASLIASGAWRRTLVMTRSEFGRAASENAAGGTEHGGAAAHFVMGGSVRGGLVGMAPRLDRLDVDGGVPASIDFRRLYASVLGACWGRADERFAPLPLLRV